jgi:hypothetical protein
VNPDGPAAPAGPKGERKEDPTKETEDRGPEEHHHAKGGTVQTIFSHSHKVTFLDHDVFHSAFEECKWYPEYLIKPPYKKLSRSVLDLGYLCYCPFPASPPPSHTTVCCYATGVFALQV